MPLASGFMYVPAELSPKLLAASGIITSDENLENKENRPKIIGMIKVSTSVAKILWNLYGFPKKKKKESLEHCWGNNFEIFRQPSSRTQILPKYSFEFPYCHLWSFADSQLQTLLLYINASINSSSAHPPGLNPRGFT